MTAPHPWRSCKATRASLLVLSWAVIPLARAAPAAAQVGDACPGRRISSVFVDNHSVFDLTDPELSDRVAWAYRTANKLHARTKESVIRRELVFRTGDCYDPERLRDSERLLRALPFVAEVDVFGVKQPDGTVHVIVDTRDEWSTRIEPKIGSGGGLAGLRVREDNLFGTGHQVAGFYIDDEEEQLYGLSAYTPQLLGTRVDASVQAGRTPVGYLLSETFSYPFVGEAGRWAWTQSLRRHDHYFEYFVPSGGTGELIRAWYPERRQSLEVGGAYRWGNRGYNRTLLGMALTGEWISYPPGPRFADEELEQRGEVPPAIVKDSISAIRAVVMTGQRNVYFVRRRALDTVNSTEDLRLGVEADISLGPSIPGISRDRDLAVELGLFTAGEPVRGLLAGLTIVAEARRSYDSPSTLPEWSGVFGRLDGWAYYRTHPDSRHLLVLALAAAGGWHDRVPFQLTLGSRTGLRGHPDNAHAGGRRVVATVEQRTYFGWPLRDLFDLGGAVFVDVGRIWAGDAEFGEDSPLRTGAGVGLRLAFPPGSRQTLRLDVGFPLGPRTSLGDARLSIGIGQLVGWGAAGRDAELERSARLGPSPLISAPEPR